MKTFKFLSLVALSSLSLFANNFQSLTLQTDRNDTSGFKNIASYEKISANSNTFLFLRESSSSYTKYPNLFVSYSSSLFDENGNSLNNNFARDVSPGADTSITLGNLDTTSSDTTSSSGEVTTTSTSKVYWCADNWARAKLFIPQGIKSLTIKADVVSSISDVRLHIAFRKFSDNTFTLNHKTAKSDYNGKTIAEINAKENEKLDDLLLNEKTIEIAGTGNFSLLSLNEEKATKYFSVDENKDGGWLYITAINDRLLSAEPMNKTRKYNSTSTLYFTYQFTIDPTAYKSVLDDMEAKSKFDSSGEPNDLTSIDEVAIDCSTNNIPTGSSSTTTSSGTSTSGGDTTTVGSTLTETQISELNAVKSKIIVNRWNLVGVSFAVDVDELKTKLNVNSVYFYNSSSEKFETTGTISEHSGIWVK